MTRRAPSPEKTHRSQAIQVRHLQQSFLQVWPSDAPCQETSHLPLNVLYCTVLYCTVLYSMWRDTSSVTDCHLIQIYNKPYIQISDICFILYWIGSSLFPIGLLTSPSHPSDCTLSLMDHNISSSTSIIDSRELSTTYRCRMYLLQSRIEWTFPSCLRLQKWKDNIKAIKLFPFWLDLGFIALLWHSEHRDVIFSHCIV